MQTPWADFPQRRYGYFVQMSCTYRSLIGFRRSSSRQGPSWSVVVAIRRLQRLAPPVFCARRDRGLATPSQTRVALAQPRQDFRPCALQLVARSVPTLRRVVKRSMTIPAFAGNDGAVAIDRAAPTLARLLGENLPGRQRNSGFGTALGAARPQLPDHPGTREDRGRIRCPSELQEDLERKPFLALGP